MTRRVLIITNDFPPRRGGIESFVGGLADGLDHDDVVVYTSRTSGAAEHDRTLGFPVVRDRSRVLLPTRRATRDVASVLVEHGCDRVVFGASTPLGLMTGRLRRVASGAGRPLHRVVAITHGHETWWARLPGTRQALRRIGAAVDVMTFVSGYCRDEVARAVGSTVAARMVRLSPGVDTHRFSPGPPAHDVRRRAGIPAQAPLVLAASRLVARKGQDTLVDAMPRVLARVPDAHLLVVGRGPAERGLRRRVDKVGCAERVHVVPSVAWEDMPDVYRAADAFALPCRTRLGGLEPEAFGIVFLEAAASGLPVVVGRSGGAPETVDDGLTGYVVDPRDHEAVADRVATLLADRELAARMGAAGRTWVTETWPQSAAVDTLRRLVDVDQPDQR